jgi:hypothetical protein
MATTTNFGWETPDDTDLVKDGAAAIRTSLNGVDASFVDLKGGTTGQVLSKASGTDLDFTWVAQDDSNAIQNAIVDAKGDIIAATAADTPARLAVGTNGQVLTVDSGEATGLKWATPAATTPALVLVSSQTFSAVTAKSIDNCFTSTYANYVVMINIDSATSSNYGYIKLRAGGTDSSSNYNFLRISAYGSTLFAGTSTSQSAYTIGTSAFDGGGATMVEIFNPQRSYPTYMYSEGNRKNGTGIEYDSYKGTHASTSAYDGLTLSTDGSAFAGTIRVYGVQNA